MWSILAIIQIHPLRHRGHCPQGCSWQGEQLNSIMCVLYFCYHPKFYHTMCCALSLLLNACCINKKKTTPLVPPHIMLPDIQRLTWYLPTFSLVSKVNLIPSWSYSPQISPAMRNILHVMCESTVLHIWEWFPSHVFHLMSLFTWSQSYCLTCHAFLKPSGPGLPWGVLSTYHEHILIPSRIFFSPSKAFQQVKL